MTATESAMHFCAACGERAVTQTARTLLTYLAEHGVRTQSEIEKATKIARRQIRRTVMRHPDLFGYGPWQVVAGQRLRTYRLSQAGAALAARVVGVRAEAAE